MSFDYRVTTGRSHINNYCFAYSNQFVAVGPYSSCVLSLAL